MGMTSLSFWLHGSLQRVNIFERSFRQSIQKVSTRFKFVFYRSRTVPSWSTVIGPTFLAQPIGLIRSPCPSVLTHDNSPTEVVRGFKFCTNTSYVNSDYVSENGPNRVIRRTAGLLILVISVRFESVAYKYVASFMMIRNSTALLTDRLQIVEFKMKYLNAPKSQVHSAS
jgi:hypothetical protein